MFHSTLRIDLIRLHHEELRRAADEHRLIDHNRGVPPFPARVIRSLRVRLLGRRRPSSGLAGVRFDGGRQ